MLANGQHKYTDAQDDDFYANEFHDDELNPADALYKAPESERSIELLNDNLNAHKKTWYSDLRYLSTYDKMNYLSAWNLAKVDQLKDGSPEDLKKEILSLRAAILFLASDMQKLTTITDRLKQLSPYYMQAYLAGNAAKYGTHILHNVAKHSGVYTLGNHLAKTTGADVLADKAVQKASEYGSIAASKENTYTNDFVYVAATVSSLSTLYNSDYTFTNSSWYGGKDALLTKFSSTGTRQFAASIASSIDDTVVQVELDKFGFVYVVGLHASGQLLRAYNSSGSVFTTSIDSTTSQNNNSYVAKYNSSGTVLGVASWEGSGNQVLNDIFIDSSFFVYVCGQSNNNTLTVRNGSSTYVTPSPLFNGFIMKLSGIGNSVAPQWYTIVKSTGNDFGYRISADSSNNVYATYLTDVGLSMQLFNAGDLATVQFTGTANASNYLMILAKYNSNGILQWAATFNILSTVHYMSLDISGNMFVMIQTSALELKDTTGSTKNFLPPSGYPSATFVIKFNTSGVYLGSAAIVNTTVLNGMYRVEDNVYLDFLYANGIFVYKNNDTLVPSYTLTGNYAQTGNAGGMKLRLNTSTFAPRLIGYYTL